MSIKSKLNGAIKLISDEGFRLQWLASRHFYDSMGDEEYLRRVFRAKLGYDLNLENPKTFNEKLQWLKLYDRRPEYTMMVDKVEVKDYVASIIGKEHIIPTLGVWEDPDDIDFDALPDQFVLKCNHNSGGALVCKEKTHFDVKAAKKSLKKQLNQNYFFEGREWPYKNVKRRILAEPIIEQLGKPGSVEYKVTCFNGELEFVTICTGVAHARFEDRFNDHYDREFNKLDWYVNYKPAPIAPKQPEKWNELIDIAERFSKGIPYLRVDMYIIEDTILFGEFTFYTWSGYMDFNPPQWNKILGDRLCLPDKHEKQGEEYKC